MMRTIILFAAAATMYACGGKPAAAPQASQQAVAAQVQTVNTAPPQPPVYQPPPVLQSESMTLRMSSTEKAAGGTLTALTPEDEKLRSSLPFAPAIAMDPVDGNKISIRATTPTMEYKGRIYYFANDTHKAMFQANPEQYTKGRFSQL